MNDPNGLYSDILLERERSAQRYLVFPDTVSVPAEFSDLWAEHLHHQSASPRLSWPASLAETCSGGRWPTFAYGTANAAILVLWHRPGMGKEKQGISPVEPITPNLGGLGHAHVKNHWRRLAPPENRSWSLLHRYLVEGLSDAGLVDPLSMVMVANLNVASAKTGETDHWANLRALEPSGRIDQILDTIRPGLVIVCGSAARKAVNKEGHGIHKVPSSLGIDESLEHPVCWEGYGKGNRHGRDMVVPFLKRWVEKHR